MGTDPAGWLRACKGILIALVLLPVLTGGAIAQATFVYWISMRGVAAEAQPSFVSLSPVATTTHSVAFAGCRGRTWYLEPGAAASVLAARAAGETVQIHRGPSGSAPSGSTVICLIQADG